MSLKNTKSEPAQTAGNAPEPQEWMRECAKELWPYAGTTPLQTGDALRGDIANVIAKHYASRVAASSQEAAPPKILPSKCKHEDFRCHVDVNRIEDIGRFTADVQVRCTQCDTPFEFIGLECGLSYDHPTCNPSAQELRVPIKPKGCEILPGIKGPTGFKVERAQ